SDLGERGLQGARRLAQIRLHRTGELREQHLARLEIGELGYLGGGERLAFENAALDDEVRVRLGEVPQALRRLDDVAGYEGQCGGASEQIVKPVHTRVDR